MKLFNDFIFKPFWVEYSVTCSPKSPDIGFKQLYYKIALFIGQNKSNIAILYASNWKLRCHDLLLKMITLTEEYKIDVWGSKTPVSKEIC